MSKIYTIDEIREKVRPVAEKYAIEKVWLFGSYARGEATEDSDVDLLIDGSKIRTLFELGGVYEDFKEALGKDIDLVTLDSIYDPGNMPYNVNLRAGIERERTALYG